MMKWAVFVIVVTLGLSPGPRCWAEGMYWGDEHGKAVHVSQLSNQRMLHYAKLIGSAELGNFPKLHAELIRRKLLDKELVAAKKQAADNPGASLSQIISRSTPPNTAPNPRQRLIAPATALKSYGEDLESIANRGMESMNRHRKSVALYRSFIALHAVGELQIIDNLARENHRLYGKLLQVGQTLTRTRGLSSERFEFYQKRAAAIAGDIDKNQKTIDHELAQIKFGTKQKSSPYRFNRGQGLR